MVTGGPKSSEHFMKIIKMPKQCFNLAIYNLHVWNAIIKHHKIENISGKKKIQTEEKNSIFIVHCTHTP